MKIQMRLCVLLTALLLLCTIPALSAEAATTVDSGTCGTNATWTLDSNGVLTISGSGSMSGYDVANEQPWYSYQSQITAIVVEEGITFVAKHAFSGCGATTISLPSTLKWIGKYAFAYNRSLTEVVIPASVTEIDDWAFNDCQSLKTLTIKGKVTLGSAVFATCSRLKTIYFEGDAPYGAEATIFGGVTATAYYPAGNNTYTDAAKACVGGNLTWIPQYKASGTCGDNLTWTLDANGVLTISGIGDMPYYETENEQPWYSCRSQIKAIVVEEGVASVGRHAFSGIDAATVSLPSTLTNIANVSFAYNEALTDLVIPANVKKIGDWAFMDCSALKTLRIQGNVTLGSAAFNSCSALTTIYFEGNAPDGAEATIFGGVTATAYYPAGNSTYSDLSKIHVGGNLTWVPQYKASGTCGDNLTWTLDSNGLLTISGTGDMNSGFDGFSEKNQIKTVVIEDGVTSICCNAFQGCSNLTSVTIPGTVKSIGNSAFLWCSSLTSVTIGSGVETIVQNAFQNCSSLTSIVIPNSVTSIGENAFNVCTSLTSVTIGSGVRSIGDAAFSSCSALTSIIIPDGVTSIGDKLFENCSSLTSVTIPDSVTVIGVMAFLNCSGLTSIDIPDSVTSIGDKAFRNCSSLTSITIPDSVTSIGESAFDRCSRLSEVTFQGTAPAIGGYAFPGASLTVHYPSNLPGWTETFLKEKFSESYLIPYVVKITLEGATMTLSNSLSMNFVVDADYLVGDGHYAVITRTYADGSTDKVTCSQDKWTSYNKDENHWYFTYENIAAKEMTDVLTVVIYNSNNEAVSNEWIDSPRDYCMRAIEDEEADKKDPEKLALYVDMLNYGAAAQTYFGYQTDDLANEGLSDAQKAYATGEVTTENKQKTPGSNYFGASLALFNEIRLNFVFDASVINTGMYAEATYTDHDNNPRTITIPGTDFLTEGKNGLMVSVTGMAVADYNQAVTCTVYNADKTVVIAATDSVGSYLGRALQVETHELFDMILKFCYSAYNAFH